MARNQLLKDKRRIKAELFNAVQSNSIQRVQELFMPKHHENDILIDPDAKKSGLRPLHLAAKYGYMEIIDILINHGASLDAKDPDGKTPLMTALHNHRYQSARLLLDMGADPDIIDNNGQTALHLVALDKRTEHEANINIIETLINHKASMNLVDSSGQTPLMKAIKNMHNIIVNELLGCGANHNTGHNSFPPLHLASKRGNNDAIRLLMSHGARINALNRYGGTALHLAVYCHRNISRVETVKLLLGYCIDVTIVDLNGETACDMAIRMKLDDIVELIKLNELPVKGADNGLDFINCPKENIL